MTSEAFHLRDLAMRWGNQPLLRAPDGRLGLWGVGHDPALLADLDRVMATIRSGVPDGRTAKVRHPLFAQDVKIADADQRNWTFPGDILETTTLSGSKIEKLSWNPLTGETLLVWPGDMHASNRGRAPFDDYVRVIILHNLHRCTFRPFWPSWAGRTPDDNVEFFELNMDAQEACERALRKAGASSWMFQYNVDNATLRDLSGRGGW